MILKNELRLGNWVKTEYKEIGNIKITEIRESVIYSNKTNGISYSSLLPIQLTEKILLKYGFIEDDFNKNGDLYLPLKNICLDGHLDYLYVKDKSEVVKLRSIRSVEIKSLHQLQNLYFCLVGKELEIKEQIRKLKKEYDTL